MTSSRSSETPSRLARAWRAFGLGLGYAVAIPAVLLAIAGAAVCSWLWPERDWAGQRGYMTKDEWRWT